MLRPRTDITHLPSSGITDPADVRRRSTAADENSTNVSKLKNLANKTFGRLIVLRRGSRKAKNAYWECRCSCGKVKQIRNDILQNGSVRSCGCLARELRPITPLKHGHCRTIGETAEYRAYYMQRNACRNPRSKNARWYHDRGIQFLFSSFEQFLAVAGRKPGPDYWLTRIDHDKDVEPGNLTWRPIKRHRHKRRRKPKPNRRLLRISAA